jgi:hypothetical protein
MQLLHPRERAILTERIWLVARLTQHGMIHLRVGFLQKATRSRAGSAARFSPFAILSVSVAWEIYFPMLLSFHPHFTRTGWKRLIREKRLAEWAFFSSQEQTPPVLFCSLFS